MWIHSHPLWLRNMYMIFFRTFCWSCSTVLPSKYSRFCTRHKLCHKLCIRGLAGDSTQMNKKEQIKQHCGRECTRLPGSIRIHSALLPPPIPKRPNRV